jgi:enoyl-CoA hydratase/carnithine racemase
MLVPNIIGRNPSWPLDNANADDKIKVIIITGAGERCFCAGGGIKYVVSD